MATNSKKPLYQPWSEEEFCSDLFVQHMTPVQRWMYRTLLQSAFFCSMRPYLPDDDGMLWMLAGCENRQQWAANKEIVRGRFSSSKIKGQPVLVQKRIVEDWKRIQNKRKELSEQGHKGGKASFQSKVDRELAEAQAEYERRQSVGTATLEPSSSQGTATLEPSSSQGTATHNQVK